MLEGEGKFYGRQNRRVKKPAHGFHGYIYVPASLVQDSQFPFKHLEKLKVTVLPEKKTIIVTPS